MIKLSPKDSEHQDLYSKYKTLDKDQETEEPIRSEAQDRLYKFKKAVSLNKSYELYLETEKSYK